MVRHGDELALISTCGQKCGRNIIQAFLGHVGGQIQHHIGLFEFTKALIGIAHNIGPVVAGNSGVQHVSEVRRRISLGNDLDLGMIFLQIGDELVPGILIRSRSLPVSDLDLGPLFCHQPFGLCPCRLSQGFLCLCGSCCRLTAACCRGCSCCRSRRFAAAAAAGQAGYHACCQQNCHKASQVFLTHKNLLLFILNTYVQVFSFIL